DSQTKSAGRNRDHRRRIQNSCPRNPLGCRPRLRRNQSRSHQCPLPGRADELFVQYTGQAVKRGDPVYSLYSPDVYTAQRDYLRARKQINDLSHDANEQTKMDATAFYNANLQKLVLWGITQEQLDKLDDEFD